MGFLCSALYLTSAVDSILRGSHRLCQAAKGVVALKRKLWFVFVIALSCPHKWR